MLSKYKIKLNAISPIIASILLIVVAVIIITIILSWGKIFTNKSLDNTNAIFKKDPTLTGFIYSENPRPEGFTIKNLSNTNLVIDRYEIISSQESGTLNVVIPLNNPITINNNSENVFPILCYPEAAFPINLITPEGTYISVIVNNPQYQSNSCTNNNNIPDPVCLGIKNNGTGDTNSDLFVICNIEDLNSIRGENLEKHYKLGINLDLNVSPYNEGEGFVPIGNSSTTFTGSFDGNGYTISNLYINRPEEEYQGLFGNTGGDAVINNVKLEDLNVTGLGYVGGLVGDNGATISNSYSTGSVSGDYGVGGLVGQNYFAPISNSYSTGSVSGYSGVGGLVGDNYGTISNSYSTGSVSGNESVGGLVGGSGGTISNSYSTGSVYGDYGVGGLVGGNNHGTISNSYSTGSVSRYSEYCSSVGGLVGYNEEGTILNSYSTGSVSGDSRVGGLVGGSGGPISNSYATGSVSGNESVGGLVGYNGATISNSYSTGSVYGDYGVGGLVGNNNATISNSYSLGDVVRLSGTNTEFGGFVGESDGTVTNCYSTGMVIYFGATNPTDRGFSSRSISGNNYWDMNTSLQSSSGGGALGKTTAQMKTQSTFTDWNFTDIWEIEADTTYPYLKNNPQDPKPIPTYNVISNYISGTYNSLSLSINLSSGADSIYYTLNGADPTCSGTGTLYESSIIINTGTSTIKAIACKEGYENSINTFTYVLPEPTIILTPTQLYNIRNNLNRFYVLGADIDLNVSPYNTGTGWDPIGNSSTKFTGSFDGNGYTISNLYIYRPEEEYQGLFGNTGGDAVINNVKLEDLNVTGYASVGGLVSSNDGGTISNSYSTGFVFGYYSVGGLVAYNNGTISNSNSAVSVSGNSEVGGLVSSNYGTISNSYSTGSVSGDSSYVGGLVSGNDGTISGSYSTGSVYGDSQVGGLVSISAGPISGSYSTGSVSGNYEVGGLVGRNLYATISGSYSTGSVSGYEAVGGLVGTDGGTISDSYSLGDVTRLSGGISTVFGGFVGQHNYGTITNCYSTGKVIYEGTTNPTDRGFSSSSISGNNYWDMNTSLQSSSGGGALGKTTAQMKTQSTFIDWDFSTIWNITAGTTYPYLRANTQSPLPQ